MFHENQTFRSRTKFNSGRKSLKQRSIAHVCESLSDSDEKQIADEQHIRRQNYFLEVWSLVAQVHEHEYDVGSFDECQNDKGPFDHAPSEGLGPLEVYPHDYFYGCEQGEDSGYSPNILSNGRSFFLTVVRVQCVAVIYDEVVTFHGVQG